MNKLISECNSILSEVLDNFLPLFPLLVFPFVLSSLFKIVWGGLDFDFGVSAKDSSERIEDSVSDNEELLTNADIIRDMDDNELLEFLNSFSPCTYCPNWSYDSNKCIAPASCNSVGVIKDYLSFESKG